MYHLVLWITTQTITIRYFCHLFKVPYPYLHNICILYTSFTNNSLRKKFWKLLEDERAETSDEKKNSRWKYLFGSGGVLGAFAIILAALISRPDIPPPPPTPTIENQPRDINSFPFTAFAYEGLGNPDVNAGYATLEIDQNGGEPIAYRLNYEIPDGSAGYGGLAFLFKESQDISHFTSVQVDIEFMDDEASMNSS
jgi:hypothetical protein